MSHGVSTDEAAVLTKVTEIFRDVFDDDSIVLRDNMTARDVPGWDSLANVRLMLSIEQAWGFQFSLTEISELRNVGDLLIAIRNRAS
ncbi:MAG TPA: acyl carrier protein [Rhizomicrobium sp.]|jgi:acyl carrier protein|nr:acyl carrier protein [Rhizomicrobium sp.]